MKTKIILVVAILGVIAIAAVVIQNLNPDYEYMFKDEIFDFVKENQELLDKTPGEIKSLDRTAFFISTTEKRNIKGQLSYYGMEDSPGYDALSGLYYGTVSEDGSRSFSSLENGVLSDIFELGGVSGIRIFPDTRFSMSFYYGGEATGKTIYYGYYYTDDNLPIGFEGEDVPLKKSGSGWTWKAEDSDDTYYTERISDNWFYYKMIWR